MKQLYRSRKNRVAAGVCGGIAEYFNVDPTIVRIAAIALMIISKSALLVYFVAAMLMPEYSAETDQKEETEPKEV